MNILSNSKTFIIAEAGVNHNGSLDMAFSLVDAAAHAGADAVKFQTYRSEQLASAKARRAKYQISGTHSNDSQLTMLKQLELSSENHHQLLKYCTAKGIQFLSSPFDRISVDFLVKEIGLTLLKIPSGEITNSPLLLKAAGLGCSVILSTGMSFLGEIEQALSVLAFGYLQAGVPPSPKALEAAYISKEGQKHLKEKVALLHCTSEYPASYESVNLLALNTLKSAFGLQLGYSDHTRGIAVPLAAVACGASIIEKHFTLDQKLIGPDHAASLEPNQLQEMVLGIRQVELALGSAFKGITSGEMETRELARKSIMASQLIKEGEVFSSDKLIIQRPGGGMSPQCYWGLLEKSATRNYEPGEEIEE